MCSCLSLTSLFVGVFFSFTCFNITLVLTSLSASRSMSAISHLFLLTGFSSLQSTALCFLGKLAVLSRWWTRWILCCWLSGFCCLPLKGVGFGPEKQLSGLWRIRSLAACFWDMPGQGWSSLQPEAGIFRGDPSEVAPNAQVTNEDSSFLSSVLKHLPALCKC